MTGMIVAAHNKEDFLDDCIKSLITASSHEGLGGEAVEILTMAKSVTTSARKRYRCKEGFGDHLNSLAIPSLLS
jgi:hypothetical protein